MNPHVFIIVGEGVAIIVMLAVVVVLFERAGEKIGYFMEKNTKLILLVVGVGLVALLNSFIFVDHEMMRPLQTFDFAFMLVFVPFCFGLWSKTQRP